MVALPSQELWSFDHLDGFVTQVRSVDPEVTGLAPLLHRFVTVVRQTYRRWLPLTATALLLLLLLALKNGAQRGRAMGVVALSAVGTVGLLGFLVQGFDLGNFFVFPLCLALVCEFALRAELSRILAGLMAALVASGCLLLLLSSSPALQSAGLLGAAGAVIGILVSLLSFGFRPASPAAPESALAPPSNLVP